MSVFDRFWDAHLKCSLTPALFKDCNIRMCAKDTAFSWTCDSIFTGWGPDLISTYVSPIVTRLMGFPTSSHSDNCKKTSLYFETSKGRRQLLNFTVKWTEEWWVRSKVKQSSRKTVADFNGLWTREWSLKCFVPPAQIWEAQNEERQFLFLYCLVFVMTQIQQTARKLYLYHKDNTYCNSLVIRERG